MKKGEETFTPTNRSQSFCRGLKWALVTCTVQMVSTKYYSLKAASLRHLLVWGWVGEQVKHTFQEQGRGKKP